MKGEISKEPPAFNLFRPEGQRDMENAKVITKVWLTNGKEFDVIPGTFHFYTTKGDRPQPFVQFQCYEVHNNTTVISEDARDIKRTVEWKPHTVEVFPASVAGIGYLTPEADNG